MITLQVILNAVKYLIDLELADKRHALNPCYRQENHCFAQDDLESYDIRDFVLRSKHVY